MCEGIKLHVWSLKCLIGNTLCTHQCCYGIMDWCVYCVCTLSYFCHLQAIPFDFVIAHSAALRLHRTCSCVEIHAEIFRAHWSKLIINILLLFIKMIMSIFAYSMRSNGRIAFCSRTESNTQCSVCINVFTPGRKKKKCSTILITPMNAISVGIFAVVPIQVHSMRFSIFIAHSLTFLSHFISLFGRIENIATKLNNTVVDSTKWLLHDILMIRDAYVSSCIYFSCRGNQHFARPLCSTVSYIRWHLLGCIRFALEKLLQSVFFTCVLMRTVKTDEN